MIGQPPIGHPKFRAGIGQHILIPTRPIDRSSCQKLSLVYLWTFYSIYLYVYSCASPPRPSSLILYLPPFTLKEVKYEAFPLSVPNFEDQEVEEEEEWHPLGTFFYFNFDCFCFQCISLFILFGVSFFFRL